ncbi:MAG: type II toxin-antitoxin system VapC family toxin [Gemmatimonadetes bacterium]|nr:type II toxin-antitoxin system VapC family toxin [Gemmatimonadota bacterium]
MTAEIFVDAGIWYGAANPRLAEHETSAAALRAAVDDSRTVVTTNLVIGEAHALLLKRVHRDAALAFLREVRNPPNVVVTSTPEIEKRAIAEWIEQYADQAFSFADAVSFAVMAERGIKEALTFDRHFAAAGFRVSP